MLHSSEVKTQQNPVFNIVISLQQLLVFLQNLFHFILACLSPFFQLETELQWI